MKYVEEMLTSSSRASTDGMPVVDLPGGGGAGGGGLGVEGGGAG